jgi:hypothetical protein
MILSVLIPTVSARASTLSRTLWYLQQQTGDFEVIVARGDQIGLGDKTNALIEAATGEYFIIVDDDDYVASHYMETVLPYLDGRFDYVGYRILALWDGRYWLSIAHDAKNPFGAITLNRGVDKKMPIRRDLILDLKLGNEFEDDWYFAQAIHNRIRTSTFIDDHLYVYDWWPETMTFPGGQRDQGNWRPQRDIGVWPVDKRRIRWL